MARERQRCESRARKLIGSIVRVFQPGCVTARKAIVASGDAWVSLNGLRSSVQMAPEACHRHLLLPAEIHPLVADTLRRMLEYT